MGYTRPPVEYTVVKSETFRRWLKSLRDRRALARIIVRIERVVEGNFGERARRMAGEL